MIINVIQINIRLTIIENSDNEQTLEAAERYRNRPLEKIADEYALAHMEAAIKELNMRLFRGLLLN